MFDAEPQPLEIPSTPIVVQTGRASEFAFPDIPEQQVNYCQPDPHTQAQLATAEEIGSRGPVTRGQATSQAKADTIDLTTAEHTSSE